MDDNKEYTTFQDAIDLISENLRSIENFLCGKEEVDYQEEYELMRSLRYLLTYMRSKKQGTISKSTTKQEKDKEAERLMDFFKKKDNINSDGTLKKGDYKGNGLDFLQRPTKALVGFLIGFTYQGLGSSLISLKKACRGP